MDKKLEERKKEAVLRLHELQESARSELQERCTLIECLVDEIIMNLDVEKESILHLAEIYKNIGVIEALCSTELVGAIIGKIFQINMIENISDETAKLTEPMYVDYNDIKPFVNGILMRITSLKKELDSFESERDYIKLVKSNLDKIKNVFSKVNVELKKIYEI